MAVDGVVDDAMIDRYWEMLRYPGNRRATMTRFSAPYDALTAEQIAAIDVPALILHGAKDRLIPPAAGRWLDDTLPRSRIVVYPEVGHLPQEEAASATADEVRRWLDRTL